MAVTYYFYFHLTLHGINCAKSLKKLTRNQLTIIKLVQGENRNPIIPTVKDDVIGVNHGQEAGEGHIHVPRWS